MRPLCRRSWVATSVLLPPCGDSEGDWPFSQCRGISLKEVVGRESYGSWKELPQLDRVVLRQAEPRVIPYGRGERPVVLATDGAVEATVTFGAVLFDPVSGLLEFAGAAVPRNEELSWERLTREQAFGHSLPSARLVGRFGTWQQSKRCCHGLTGWQVRWTLRTPCIGWTWKAERVGGTQCSWDQVDWDLLGEVWGRRVHGGRAGLTSETAPLIPRHMKTCCDTCRSFKDWRAQYVLKHVLWIAILAKCE